MHQRWHLGERAEQQAARTARPEGQRGGHGSPGPRSGTVSSCKAADDGVPVCGGSWRVRGALAAATESSNAARTPTAATMGTCALGPLAGGLGACAVAREPESFLGVGVSQTRPKGTQTLFRIIALEPAAVAMRVARLEGGLAPGRRETLAVITACEGAARPKRNAASTGK